MIFFSAIVLEQSSAEHGFFIELDDGKILTGKPYISW